MKSSGCPTTPAHSTLPPWSGVGGERVGVLEVLGDVAGLEHALSAGVGAHDHLLLGLLDGDHGAAHAVVDGPQVVVATGDDAIADRELAAGDLDALAEQTLADELGASEGVQARAAVVVTHDEDRLPPRALGLALAPPGDRRPLARRGGLLVASDDVDPPVLVLVGDEVSGSAAAHL